MTPQQKIYFDRYAWPERLIERRSLSCPDLVIVLPSYKETELKNALVSLQLCDPPEGQVEIIVIVNEPESASTEITKINQKSIEDILNLKNNQYPVHIIHKKLPDKKAGVGLARKIGMDEASRWFSEGEKNGIIACYDADSTCQVNYLQAIECFYKASLAEVGLMYYEHPLELDNGIVEYELYLRFYAGGLRWAGFDLCFQTLGSCITVKSDSYVKYGGMNTRKAGEDFYFLHKIMPFVTTGDITTTTVFPAERVSDRVPFGTGRALMNFDPQKAYEVYNPRIFEKVALLIEAKKTLLKKPTTGISEIDSWLQESHLAEKIEKQRKNASNYLIFEKHLNQLIDGFQVLKYIHYLREHHHESIELSEGLQWLNKELWEIKEFEKLSLKEKLRQVRKWDKTHPRLNKVV